MHILSLKDITLSFKCQFLLNWISCSYIIFDALYVQFNHFIMLSKQMLSRFTKDQRQMVDFEIFMFCTVNKRICFLPSDFLWEGYYISYSPLSLIHPYLSTIRTFYPLSIMSSTVR